MKKIKTKYVDVNETFRKICAKYSINWGDSGNHRASVYELLQQNNKCIHQIIGESTLFLGKCKVCGEQIV